MHERRDLFKLMHDSVVDCAAERSLRNDQAFGLWFAKLYFGMQVDPYISDGTRDGKVDLFFEITSVGANQHIVINTKFTNKYDEPAPAKFYDEVTRFWQAIANKNNRPGYLKYVRADLRNHYRKIFRAYDLGTAQLMFVTNHRRTETQYQAIKNIGVTLIHLEELLQFVLDDLEGAMPRTNALTLSGVSYILTSERRDTTVPIHVVFARLIDFIDYMETDPFKLLFARNVRLWLGNTPVNHDILKTFEEAPEEFAYSNNGITMLAEKIAPNPARHELKIVNPRIVNGAQTLHSIISCNGSGSTKRARVMVRIIEVEPPRPDDLSHDAQSRKELIAKIAVRTNFQNPIKKWDLVSNDDFQHEIARYFRKRKYFYERRKNEWSFRKGNLTPVGVRRGPYLRSLMQYIAAYFWHKHGLGPAAAKGQLKELFEDRQYGIIRRTPISIIYQIFMLSEILKHSVKIMARQHRYTEYLRRAGDLTLFTLVVKLLEAKRVSWGSDDFSEFLKGEFKSIGKEWQTVTKLLNGHIWSHYRATSARYRKSRGKDLSLANYFGNDFHVQKLLAHRMPKKIGNLLNGIVARV